jgi:hypothetical protein
MGYNGKKNSALWDTTEENSSNILILCAASPTGGKFLLFFLSHIGKKSLPLYSTMEENLFCCIPYRKKNLKVNNCAKINFSAKSILLMNQDPR